MAKQVTTLFIRETEVSLLLVRGDRIKKWASLPLEQGLLIKEGLILDEARVADRVKDLFKLEKVGKRKVIVGLSGVNSLYRMITLPDLPDAILPEAVKREAARVIPVPLNEVYLSYQSVPAPKGERRVFLVTFPRDVADALLRTLRLAGIKPYVTDIAPLALSRIPNEPRAIIVNAKLEHLGIMIVVDRIPQVIRRLSLPSEVESLSEQLPVISEELTRTIAFYNASHVEKPLDATVPVFVSGDLAEQPETWSALAVERFGHSVSPLPSPLKFPEVFNPNEFMVNIGLALKELPREKKGANFSLVNFNALPEAYRPQPASIARIAFSAGVVAIIGLLVLGAIFVYHGMAHIEELRSRLIVAERAVAQQHKEAATLREQIAQMEARIAVVQTEIGLAEATAGALNATLTDLKAGREDVDGDLQTIIPPPEEVIVTSVSHGGGMITLSGTAPLMDIFEYARYLRGSGRFAAVHLSPITRVGGGEDDVERFSFTLHLRN
jgi:type IV pilus assembly protein PilM